LGKTQVLATVYVPNQIRISTLKVKEEIMTPVLHKNHQKKSSQMMFSEINEA
jgi:hypothetical protein